MTEPTIDEFAADMVLDEFLDAADGSDVPVDALTNSIAACASSSSGNVLQRV